MQIGLLSKDNVEQIPFAYKLFKSTSKSNEALASGFKATFSREVPIDFVGVWYVASRPTRMFAPAPTYKLIRLA